MRCSASRRVSPSGTPQTYGASAEAGRRELIAHPPRDELGHRVREHPVEAPQLLRATGDDHRPVAAHRVDDRVGELRRRERPAGARSEVAADTETGRTRLLIEERGLDRTRTH